MRITDINIQNFGTLPVKNEQMELNPIHNYARLKPSLFFLPIFLLISLVLFLYSQDALNVDGYIRLQKESFFFINSKLGQYPNLEYNLTQIGNALIFLSFLSIFIVYAPKMWEALVSGSLVSLILSSSLKNIFSVPRPAAVFDNSKFIIVGEVLSGHTKSLPSGHSITIFTILTVLLFAYMPRELKYKILWVFLIILAGLVLAFTRVGIGAHHPLDVITGCIIGYISGLAGIFISRKYRIWNWFSDKKYYPVFILLLMVCCGIIISKIIDENLIVFYLSTACLVVSLYKIITSYVKK